MGTRRAFDRERSGGKGFTSTDSVASTPTADLPEVDPNAGHQGEFVVAVLEGGYQ